MTTTYRPSYASLWNLWVVLLIGALLAVRPGFFAYLIQSHVDMAGVEPFLAPALRGLGGIACIWMLLSICYQRLYSHYVLYEDRIVAVHGILRRRESTAEYPHIRSIELQKSLPGMLLGYGDLLLGTAGTGETNVNMRGVDAPEKIRDRLRELQQAHLAPLPDNENALQNTAMPTPQSQPGQAAAPAPSTPAPVPDSVTFDQGSPTPSAPMQLNDTPGTSLPVDPVELNAELDRRFQNAQGHQGGDS